jgi:hypothetical protein
MNAYYAVFMTATGELVRWGDCLASDVERQALFPGEIALPIEGPPDPSLPELTLQSLSAQEAADG